MREEELGLPAAFVSDQRKWSIRKVVAQTTNTAALCPWSTHPPHASPFSVEVQTSPKTRLYINIGCPGWVPTPTIGYRNGRVWVPSMAQSFTWATQHQGMEYCLVCPRLAWVLSMVLLSQAATNCVKKYVGVWGFVPLNPCRNMATIHKALLAVLREK